MYLHNFFETSSSFEHIPNDYCVKLSFIYNGFRALGSSNAHPAHQYKNVGYYYINFSHNSMNKQDIANRIHEVLNCTKADGERAVETVISSIIDGVRNGEEVSIAGLGIFSAKIRPARTGRNPRTGENIEIPAMRAPKFRAAKAFKDAVK